MIVLIATFELNAQDELLEILEDTAPLETEYASATFKAQRIVSAHSVEMMKPGMLEFRISHRFGRINSGASELFGLDQSNIYLGLEMGLTNWLELGIGRTPTEKTVNGFAKTLIKRQAKGASPFPITVGYFASMAINASDLDTEEKKYGFDDRLSYTHQLLLARKISDDFSVQLSPTLIHRNLVATKTDANDIYSLGFGARYKLTNRTTFNIEYFHIFDKHILNDAKVRNPLSIGFDIETGGHVFQLFFSNSAGIIEKHYIADNTGLWSEGDIRFGFNITRPFTIFN